MLYSCNWLSIRKNGRFALCWLAATNPTAFRTHVKKGQLETVRVSNICDELMKILNTREPTKRISFHLAANLAYGAVKIYQKIVNQLWDDVSSSLVVQSFVLSTIMQQDDFLPQERPNGENPRAGASKSKKPPKKRPKLMIQNLDLGTQSQEFLNFPESVLSTSNELITLREVNLQVQEKQEEPNLNDFGQMTTQEASELLDFLEISVTDQRLIAEINGTDQDSFSSADIPRHEATPEDFAVPGPSRIDVSTPIPPQTPSFNQDVSPNKKLPEAVPRISPVAPEEIPETPDLSIPPPKKRKKTLQIDQVISLPDRNFFANMKCNTQTRKRGRPKENFLDLSEMKNFPIKACRKRKAEPLKELFQRNCKIRCQENIIEDILAEILLDPDPNNNIPAEEVMSAIMEDFNQFGRKKPNRKRPAEQIELPPPPPMENMDFQAIPPALEEIVPPAVAPRDFQEIPQEQIDQLDDFTTEKTLMKLQTFWKKKQKPISMKNLLHGVVARKVAARAFMSLLELGKMKQVKLHKAGGLEISHISPGTA